MGKSNWIKDEDQKGNFSNNQQDTFDPKKRYIGVRLQQGVPLLDRDWNEFEDIRRYEEQMLRKNYIGDGSPDDGFKISAAESPDDNNNFRIGSGHFLVDGFDVVNEPPEQKPYINYTDQKQVDTLAPPTDEEERDDTVYLDVWIKEVRSKQTAPEETDPEKIDEALGNTKDVNTETSVRHRLVWRVRVHQSSEEYEKDPTHHYYEIAKIKRHKGHEEIRDADIQDLRKVIGQLAQENWINVDLNSPSWVNFDETKYNSPSYFRDTNGIVHLRGSVRQMSEEKVIFRLDKGYRPAKNEIQVIPLFNNQSVGFSICMISDSGDVLHMGSRNPVSGVFLDGITFRAELK
jgi:hypothetical protein